MKLCPPSLRRVLPPRRCQVQSKDPQRLTPSGVAPRWLGLVERLGKFKPFLCTTYTIKQLWPIECFDEFVVSHVRVSGLIIPSIRSKPLLVYVYIYIFQIGSIISLFQPKRLAQTRFSSNMCQLSLTQVGWSWSHSLQTKPPSIIPSGTFL